MTLKSLVTCVPGHPRGQDGTSLCNHLATMVPVGCCFFRVQSSIKNTVEPCGTLKIFHFGGLGNPSKLLGVTRHPSPALIHSKRFTAAMNSSSLSKPAVHTSHWGHDGAWKRSTCEG